MPKYATGSVKVLATRVSRWRSGSRVLMAAAAGMVLAVGIFASPAAAVTASIALKPGSGPPTTNVSVSGSGFGASESVAVDFGATKVATTTTSATGTFSTAFTVPKTAVPGNYPVTAIGQASGLKATAHYLVRSNSPQFHFNQARTGFNQYENVIGPSNVSKLTRAWTDKVSSSVGSSPAVVNGVAYVVGDGGLFAFNATTGALLWSHPGIFFGQSSPAVSNGIVYAAAVDGNFYAFSTNAHSANCSGKPVTCKPLWTAAIEGAGTVAQSSPTVANGMVFVSAGYELYAYSAAGTTGCSGTPKVCSPLWTAAISPVNGESPVSGQSSPTVVGGVLYVGGIEGLYAYSAAGTSGCSGTPKTCQPLWLGDTGQVGSLNSVGASSPAVVGGVAYVGAGNQLVAFSTTCSGTCSPLWRFDTGGQVSSSPAVANGKVYIAGGNAKMYVLSTAGTPLWTATISAGDSSSPTVANGVVYIGAFQNLVAFKANGCSAATCSPLWSAALTDTSFATPTVVNGMVYQGEATNGQYLAAYKLP